MAGSNIQEVSSVNASIGLDRSMHCQQAGTNIFIYAFKSMHIKLALKIHSLSIYDLPS